MDLNKYIRNIKDFPKSGIVYRDITPLLLAPKAMDYALQLFLADLNGIKIDKIVGIESRGFFFAALLAKELGLGLVPIRKAGKLPYDTYKESYSLEYGKDELEMHCDAIQEGDNVLIHDDVLATGGTAAATVRLVEKAGGKVVRFNFILELTDLDGRKLLNDLSVFSLLKY